MTAYGMPPDFFTTPSRTQFNASATQPMTSHPGQQNAQGTWSPHMAAQSNASAPPPMTPHQRLAILLQPQSPSEVLISQSPHQKGVNWIFHNQASGQL